MSKEKLKLEQIEHTKHHWQTTTLLNDFRVEDVWLLPFLIDPNRSLNDVLNNIELTMQSLTNKGFAGSLFKFRLFLGKLFNWDTSKESSELGFGKIRERYLKSSNFTPDQLALKKMGSFTPVYFLEMEYLLELENKIVSACLHLSKIPYTQNTMQIHMTVFVNTKGRFGKMYMLLIKPFRLFIVYPSLLKELKIQWLKNNI